MLDNFFSALDFISGILLNRFLQFLVIGGSSMLHGLVHLNIIGNDINPSIYFKSPSVKESENSEQKYLLVVSRRSPIISETVLSRQQCAKSWHICRKVFFLLLQSWVQTYLVKRSLSRLSSLDVALTYWSYFIGNEDNISAEFDQSNITCPSIEFLAVHFVNSWLGYTNTLDLILVWPVSHLLIVHHSKVDTEAM